VRLHDGCRGIVRGTPLPPPQTPPAAGYGDGSG